MSDIIAQAAAHGRLSIPDHQLTFSLRPNERPHFHRQRPSGPIDGVLYAVMLPTAPAFPAQQRPDGPYRSLALAFLMARYDRGRWVWVNPDTVSKQFLANAMQGHRAAVDHWYYMVLDRGEE